MLCIPLLHSALLKSDLHLPRGFSACVQRGCKNVQNNCKKVQMMKQQDVVYEHFVFIMSIGAQYKSSVSIDKYKLIIYFYLAVFPQVRVSTVYHTSQLEYFWVLAILYLHLIGGAVFFLDFALKFLLFKA